MLARMDPLEDKGNLDGTAEGLMKAAHRQHPDLFRKMRMSAKQARRATVSWGYDRVQDRRTRTPMVPT